MWEDVRRIKSTSEDPAVVKGHVTVTKTIPRDDPLFDEAPTGIYRVLDDRDKQTMLILSIRNVICLLRWTFDNLSEGRLREEIFRHASGTSSED
jgi:hypothetical protein